MIKIILITGFLGTGKTTFLKDILSTYKDEKVGVIINEFGAINIDGALVKEEGVEIAELSNGSIFCACIKDKFLDSLIHMSARDLDYLFIEASGLADPSNMTQILDAIKPKCLNTYAYKGAICVVDSVHFMDMITLLPALTHQLQYSNSVIVNKVDLVQPSKVEAVAEEINQINGEATLYITSYCKVDIKEVVNHLTVSKRHWEETTNTVEAKPKTFYLKGDGPVSLEKLMLFLEELSEHTYRIKGFVETDEGNKEISCVKKLINIANWEGPIEENQIVLISAVGIKLISQISQVNKNYFGDGLKL